MLCHQSLNYFQTELFFLLPQDKNLSISFFFSVDFLLFIYLFVYLFQYLGKKEETEIEIFYL